METGEDQRSSRGVRKCKSGIRGLDEIIEGDLPRGRTTLVCGGPGCGKTLLGLEFLLRGATQFDEAGVFVSFEERPAALRENVASIGFDLAALEEARQIELEHIVLAPGDVVQSGDYDLDGLFVRLNSAISKVGAKRVVLDTVEALFTGLPDATRLRSELCRLLRWLEDEGVTSIVTAEGGRKALTRQGLEEYVSDCVITLTHRIDDHVGTRLLRVVKYRGSGHGTNEYPFLIDDHGLSVLPVTSFDLDYAVSDECISSGIGQLDAMLDGRGYYRGSTVLVSGPAGTGKSSVAAHFIDAACARGERALYFTFEESQSQILRNTAAVGVHLQRWVDADLLRFRAVRPTMYGLEMHLALICKIVNEFQARCVVLDPITDFEAIGTDRDVKSMLMRLVNFFKQGQITPLLISLTTADGSLEESEVGLSSLIDTWLLLRNLEFGGERNRGLNVLKSRGMAHSNQIREFLLTKRGVELVPVYISAQGIFAGSARVAREAQDRAAAQLYEADAARRRDNLRRQRAPWKRKSLPSSRSSRSRRERSRPCWHAKSTPCRSARDCTTRSVPVAGLRRR